eukprot:Skav234262  [mRNA]  locus=scaffold1464:790131:790651:+ [translate_table: standard]
MIIPFAALLVFSHFSLHASRDQALSIHTLDLNKTWLRGLKRTGACTEHLTAGVCESHKVDVGGIQAFRCSWKASIPAGDNPAVPAQCHMAQGCQVDMEAGSCGLTNSTGPSGP